MTEELNSDETNGLNLLKQLEHILESDTLIDEVGFIHPSQFAALNDGSSDDSQYDSTVFWNKDNKLAISTDALFPLYNAAKHTFMTTMKLYKILISSPGEADTNLDGMVTGTISVSGESLETEVMKHSKALLLLSWDFGTAWNSRKLVVLKKQQFLLFMDELLLSALILSYSPKSEHAWSHRRWVIKRIDGKCPNFQDLVERESELVEKIAEGKGNISLLLTAFSVEFLQKSKMNYRAWSHRCWLIAYMTKEQVRNELNKSRKWAELHVGDNSCFDYRQHLLHRMLEHSYSKLDPSGSSYCTPDVYHFWMEELDWNEMLIKRYIGRESLWVHRRFLSQFGLKHFCFTDGSWYPCGVDIDNFVRGEFQLFQSCLTISDTGFEDGQAQGLFAAAYILRVSKQLLNSGAIELQEKLRDLGALKTALNQLCPEKTLLWNDLIGGVNNNL
ncbi:hypothetical protein IFM89_018360 [Coptis chinensis]|uniref:Uncharacterized protein n=1 Tax=Coptis chinensis TaxID=261450 RepID=A0A835HIC4_9MAGN|nr:hypothetical protein IFM89_018360 [Coptis chinensis]